MKKLIFFNRTKAQYEVYLQKPPVLVDVCTCQGEPAVITTQTSNWLNALKTRAPYIKLQTPSTRNTKTNLTILLLHIFCWGVKRQIKMFKRVQLEAWKNPTSIRINCQQHIVINRVIWSTIASLRKTHELLIYVSTPKFLTVYPHLIAFSYQILKLLNKLGTHTEMNQ